MKATEAQRQTFIDQWDINHKKLEIYLREKKNAILHLLSMHDMRSVESWEQSFFSELAQDGFCKWLKDFYEANKSETNIMEDEVMNEVDQILKNYKRPKL